MVENDNGGISTSSDFILHFFDGETTNTFNGSATGTVFILTATTTYSVTEDEVSDYTSSFGVNCEGTINPGEHKTCTITNYDNSATLTIIKNTVGGDDIFNFTISGATATSTQVTTIEGSGTSAVINLNSGTSTITELETLGWNFSNASCIYDEESFGISGVGSETISVDSGDEVICTFNNTKEDEETGTGTLVIIKNVLASDGETDLSDDTQFSVSINNGSTTISSAFAEGSNATFFNLPVGIYTIIEEVSTNHTLVSISSSSVEVTEEGTVTITITNKQNTVVNENPGGGSSGGSSRSGSVQRNQGVVLGASTDFPACTTYITEYMWLGHNNNPTQVMLLQFFLNLHMNAQLSVTGIFDSTTEAAVKAFQLKYSTETLTPWVSIGLLPNSMTPTGRVYKTTLRQINMLVCPSLNLPVPTL